MGHRYNWIAKEIAGLDPDTDYERIVALTTAYYQTNFVGNVLYSTAVMDFSVRPSGSQTLAVAGAKQPGEGKVLTQRQKRADDTLSHFWKWFEEGPSSPEVRRSIEFVNRLHMRYAKQLPGSWSHNEDFVYPLCWMGAQNHRFRLWLGLPGYTENQKIAAHRFSREMAALFRSENGPILDFPSDFDGMLAVMDRYEAQPWEFVPEGQQLGEALIDQFCERWFPKRLRWLGRQFLLSVSRDRTLGVYHLEGPNPLARRVVRAGLKAVVVAQERILPDPRRSAPERARRKARLDPMHAAPPMVKDPVTT